MVNKNNELLICGIHQPNMFPWIGYFNKIYKVNKFVLMDNVFKSRGRSWENCVKVVAGNKNVWLKCPIKNREFTIKEIEIDNSVNWMEKIEKLLKLNYSKSRYYDEVMGFFLDILYSDFDLLSNYNENFIRKTCKMLNINTEIIKQSEFLTREKSTKLLIEIIKSVECNAYMCGGGAAGYQEDNLFEEAGIKLIYQNFSQQPYNQFTDNFVSGLSILDTLFHCGFTGTENLVKAEVK